MHLEPRYAAHSRHLQDSLLFLSFATGQDSPLDSPAMSLRFIPEVEATSSIRSIQIEERAMKDLKRFYSSVKVVKNKS
ncbi:hypothetical protein GOBAR_DD35312 [Gossypium barbadense]|nr:hypothetical protein GOBAR_DD35312 [Gossypium barbadense]